VRLLSFLQPFFFGVNAVSAEEKVWLNRVLFAASTEWFVFSKKSLSEDGLIYRKYAIPVIDGQITMDRGIKNLLNLTCRRNRQPLDHITLYVPEWIALKTIDERSWISRMELRILTDHETFTTISEYRARELYIDINPDNRRQITNLLASKEIAIEFGPSDERINIYQSATTPGGGNMNGFVKELLTSYASAGGLGNLVKALDALGMLKSCLTFKRNGQYW
jgi:hypothetical protein